MSFFGERSIGRTPSAAISTQPIKTTIATFLTTEQADGGRLFRLFWSIGVKLLLTVYLTVTFQRISKLLW